MGNRITSTVSLSRQKSRVHRAMRPLVSPLRARRERPRRGRAAEQRHELAPFQLMEVHSIPASQVGWQDSEGAANSQRVSERPYNLFAGACAGRQTTNR